jgi:FUS-interacting serine-arginine-rich protein 1
VSLLVRNLPPDVNQNDLQSAFSRIGAIRDVYIPRDYHSQQPKGFAFVEYSNLREAVEAREEMDRFIMKGRELEVVFAQERRKTPDEMRSRVVNLQNHPDESSGGGGGGRRDRGGGGGSGGDRDRERDRDDGYGGEDRDRDDDRRRGDRDRSPS